MERGEIEVHPSSTWTSVKGSYSQWIAEGKLKILLQFGAKPTPDLPNVPFARDLATSEDDKLLLDVAMAPGAVGRPYMMGPSVPPERVTAMRKAIMDSYKDPEAIEEAKKVKVELDPLPSEDVVAIINKAYATPQRIIERLQKISASKE
jgi:tripartite-type tricarboxylate transporter receptor subunit TctC